MTTTELKPRPRLPDWLRITLPTSDSFARTRGLLDELKLHTVCESAKCPNHWECWSKGTATFMIAGDRCTRACGFCAVSTAKPLALEADEPARVAEAIVFAVDAWDANCPKHIPRRIDAAEVEAELAERDRRIAGLEAEVARLRSLSPPAG